MQPNAAAVVFPRADADALPDANADLVARPTLAARIARRPVTLLAAPTGYGKTTLLTEWRHGESRRVAWLGVEPADREPSRFWMRVGAAAGVWIAAFAPEDAVAQLVDALDGRGPLVVVLDDVHTLCGSETEATLRRFAAYLPSASRLVLAGRAAPALRLPALAAGGRVELLRAPDLALEPAEVIWLARRVARVPPSRSQLAELVRDAEGWPAGAYLLARAHGRGRRGAADVGDYLLEELVDALPAGERDFLLRTSVLDRLTPAACDALLDRRDSREVLDRLLELGVLLAPHEDGGMRYHRLLAELLRSELARRTPALARLLRGRAADRAAGGERRDPAIGGHGDRPAAASCAAYATRLYQTGRNEEALAWAARVGVEQARQAPEAAATCFAIRSLASARLSQPAAAAEAARTSVAIAPGAPGLLALAKVELRTNRPAAARRSLEAALRHVAGQPGLEPEIREELAALGPDGPPAAAARSRRGEELSPAELRVLRLLPGGLTQREIGRELYLSLNTVKTHVGAIFRKLGAGTRSDAVARARRLNLIPPG